MFSISIHFEAEILTWLHLYDSSNLLFFFIIHQSCVSPARQIILEICTAGAAPLILSGGSTRHLGRRPFRTPSRRSMISLHYLLFPWFSRGARFRRWLGILNLLTGKFISTNGCNWYLVVRGRISYTFASLHVRFKSGHAYDSIIAPYHTVVYSIFHAHTWILVGDWYYC